jgi:peptidyl-tRNA hydrolase, PTH1 family
MLNPREGALRRPSPADFNEGASSMSSHPQSPIRLIVGLGNPGRQYEETRHNAGFWFVELIARQHGIQFRNESKFHGEACAISQGGRECRLLKPMTYMNRSGAAVAAIANFYKITPEEILVAHDELDLPAGDARLKFGGGHAGHNGLRDIISALGGNGFWRLRIGIERPAPGGPVIHYVLGRPSQEHYRQIDDALARSTDALPQLLAGEQAQAMNRLHSGR